MSLNHSPSVVANGLVMYYDMSNTEKSWRGPPTTNYVNPNWTSWSIDGSGQAALGVRTIQSNYDCIITDTVSNTRQSIMVTGLTASTAYTFSVKFKKITGAPTLRFQLQSWNGATPLTGAFPTTVQIGITDKEGWQTASYTYTTAAGADRVYWYMQDGDDYITYSHSFQLKEPQAETGTFATTFVAGTRTNTQAIVDLTGNNTLTANSLTYASDNTFNFNGSSNYITCAASPNWAFGNTGSIEQWVYVSAISGVNHRLWCTANTVTGLDAYLNGGTYNVGLHGGTVVTVSPLPAAQWVQIVVTYTLGTIAVYFNGVLQALTGTTIGFNITNNSTLYIGQYAGGGSYYFNGKIPSMKVYRRALSAAEVVQNFNALRARYSI